MENFGLADIKFTGEGIVLFIARLSVGCVISYYTVKWVVHKLSPTTRRIEKAKLRGEEVIRRVSEAGVFELDPSKLDEHELMIASHLYLPEDISVTWNDIAGLETVIEDLRETVVLPIKHKELFTQSQLAEIPKGILLYGSPGCGKSLVARSTAKESGMRFISIDEAAITDEWYGESQKLTAAVFSLAEKVQPCIIFIDEMDSFLRTRSFSDDETAAMIKMQFMVLWDGIITNPTSRVIVIGATNNPKNIDKAIIRRMPVQYHLGLPTDSQRKQILRLLLKSENTSEKIDYNYLSRLTKGFTGDELRALCRSATDYRLSEVSRLSDPAVTPLTGDKEDITATGVTMDDLLQSYQTVRQSKINSGQGMPPESEVY